MISCFKNCTSQEVLNEIDIYSALDIIKIPHPAILHCIIEARSCKEIGKNKEYSQIKRSLPAITFNFSFDDWKNNKTIIGTTGFIYIDINGTTDIDLENPVIFVSWISLSGKGRGILLRVNDLTLKNFNYTYKGITKKLKVRANIGGSNATQFTLLSYDKNIYQQLLYYLESKRRVKGF